MALIKPVPTPFGIDAVYHHIAAIQVHYQEGYVDVHLLSFLDQEARFVGMQPLGNISAARFDLSSVCINGKSEPARAEIYTALKKRPEWIGAVDG